MKTDLSKRLRAVHSNSVQRSLGSDILLEAALEIERAVPPWQALSDDGWMIVGMNHYRLKGVTHLFCSMAKKGRCITAENIDESAVFETLTQQALLLNRELEA